MAHSDSQPWKLVCIMQVGLWAERNLPTAEPPMLTAFEVLLDEENPDLLKWLTGQLEPPTALTKNPAFVVRAFPHQSWMLLLKEQDVRNLWHVGLARVCGGKGACALTQTAPADLCLDPCISCRSTASLCGCTLTRVVGAYRSFIILAGGALCAHSFHPMQPQEPSLLVSVGQDAY